MTQHHSLDSLHPDRLVVAIRGHTHRYCHDQAVRPLLIRATDLPAFEHADCNPRDIYYKHVELFKTQAVVDKVSPSTNRPTTQLTTACSL
jgi:hypothetical protein